MHFPELIFYLLSELTPPVVKPSTWDNSTWVAMAVALMATVYVLAKSRKKKKDPLSNPPATFGVSQQRAVEREMQNLLVELSEMSRQISAQLDTRSKKLELLIDEADKRIAHLSAMGSAPVSPKVPSQVNLQSSPANGEHQAMSIDTRSEPQAVVDPRHLEIYNLATQGMTAFQIADRLGRPKGEIDLILALRPRG